MHTARGGSVDAWWSRGAPSWTLSSRYWPSLNEATYAGPRCTPSDAHYTGFHGEGGAFCRGLAGDVDAGNALQLALRSPSGALDWSLLPTGFLSSVMQLNGRPLNT